MSEVHGNETFGLSLFTDTGLCLQLGFDGFESKFQRLTPVMADLDRKNLKVGFLLIDLSDPAKINVQQRNLLAPAGPAGNGRRREGIPDVRKISNAFNRGWRIHGEKRERHSRSGYRDDENLRHRR